MDQAVVACPQGSFVRAQAIVANACRLAVSAGWTVRPRRLRLAQGLTAILLAIVAAVEAWLGAGPHTFVLLVGSCVLGLAAFGRPEAHPLLPSEPTAHKRDDVIQSEIVLQLAAQQADSLTAPTLSREAWGDLMARVSHDLRTPLNAVIGFSDVMGSELFGPVGDQRYREYIAHIRDSGRELLRSAEDTLAITSLLGGKSIGKGEPVNLEAVATEALRTCGVGQADCQFDDTLDVVGDQRALRQMLVNLVSEALLRGDAGARPRLSARCEDDFAIVEVAIASARGAPNASEASMHICMARVLLELQGARLIEYTRQGQWRAVTVLARSSQQEFFAQGAVPMGWRPRLHLDARLSS
jgi:signal transduction histidine kinase